MNRANKNRKIKRAFCCGTNLGSKIKSSEKFDTDFQSPNFFGLKQNMNNFSTTRTILAMLLLLITHTLANAQTVAVNSDETQPAREKSLREAIYNNSQTDSTITQRQSNYVRPAANKRFKRYLNKTIGTGLIGVGAVIDQIREAPPEWERNGTGFARRFASSFGENAISETVAYGVEEAFRLDSKFYKSKKRDFGSRLKNAFLSGITARRPNGKRVFNPAPFVGSYTANIISTQTWYPKRYNYQDGLRQGTQNVGFGIGFGFINEFILNRK